MNKAIIGGIIAAVAISAIVAVLAISPESGTPPVTLTKNEKLGLIVNSPSNEITLEELDRVFSQASSTGVGRNNHYLFWNLLEPEKDQYNWKQSDVLMSFNKKNNMKVTLYFSVINGKTLGPFPDWIGKPNLGAIPKDRLVKVLDNILTRYNIIDTVIIGGNVDAHFRYNEQDMPVYQKFFTEVYLQIKEKHPNVKIGNAFSLHGTLNKQLEHIVKAFQMGDFVAFSYFPVDSLNDINKTPEEAREDLEKIFELVPNRQVGIFEISWSTSSFVNGTKPDQAEFLKTTFDFYNQNESKIEFLTWYRQYDRPEGTCIIDPEEVEGSVSVGGGSGLGSSEFVIERLSKYICNAGLIDVEGKPKPAWSEFSRQVQMITKS